MFFRHPGKYFCIHYIFTQMKSTIRTFAELVREAVEKLQDRLFDGAPAYRPGLEADPVRIKTQTPPGITRNPGIR